MLRDGRQGLLHGACQSLGLFFGQDVRPVLEQRVDRLLARGRNLQKDVVLGGILTVRLLESQVLAVITGFDGEGHAGVEHGIDLANGLADFCHRKSLVREDPVQVRLHGLEGALQRHVRSKLHTEGKCVDERTKNVVDVVHRSITTR